MSYKVPQSPSLPKHWPHWYSLLSLAFHGWVIWRGTVILRYQATRGYEWSDWVRDQRFLFLASIAIAVVCIVSIARRTNAEKVVIANSIYSFGLIGSALSHLSITGPSKNPNYLFSGLIGLIVIIFLINAVYMGYRLLTPRELT